MNRQERIVLLLLAIVVMVLVILFSKLLDYWRSNPVLVPPASELKRDQKLDRVPAEAGP